jgi:hypothetical protein
LTSSLNSIPGYVHVTRVSRAGAPLTYSSVTVANTSLPMMSAMWSATWLEISCTWTDRTYAALARRSDWPSEAYTTARMASIARTPMTIRRTVPRSRAGAPT